MGRWRSAEGEPFPLGVTWIQEERAYNFALYSKHAERVLLLLYSPDDLARPCFVFDLNHRENKSGRIWHCRLPQSMIGGARFYAYSIDGPPTSVNGEWHAFDPTKILLDPYARGAYFPDAFSRAAAQTGGCNAGKAPLGVLETDRRPFDWAGEPRVHHESDLIIYEMHVRGFTRADRGVAEDKRGTFAGVVEKIPYLKRLGVTAVELLPVFQFDSSDGNYWGYMTLNFFAPHQQFAAAEDPVDKLDEFRSMVKELHRADIEVILDVVYNHTAEGNHEGPTYSFKGIDNSTYYMYSGDPANPYANFSGTGNTLRCANRYVRRMILDSLRFWYSEMHVDGFRFDLASAFARKTDGSIDWSDPAIFGEIRSDPKLGGVRLIAEPWDAGGAYQLGKTFPGTRWFQWNGRYRDDVRRFVRGDYGMVSSLMYRLYGSDDLFPDDRMHAYHPYQSINYVTSHDGFTLNDLVSFDRKHNLANGHDNLDGTTDNYSWNCGHEGNRGASKRVRALRRRQVKNFCCLLFLSNGTPMFLAGDEFLQTQGGNNNPYNQDNETTWLDWDLLERNGDVFRFFSRMIRFRKDHPTLCRSRYWRHDVRWHGTGEEVDLSHRSRHLAFFLDGNSQDDDDLYVMINGENRDLSFVIQDGPAHEWKRVVDTSRRSPDDFLEPGREAAVRSLAVVVKQRSVVVLVRPRRSTAT